MACDVNAMRGECERNTTVLGSNYSSELGFYRSSPLHPLADRRLRYANCFCRSSEAAQLGGLREGLQVGKLQTI